MKPQRSKHDEDVAYLLSFLQILVLRNGGEMVINNLSEFSGKSILLRMDVQSDKDRVILKARIEP